jgi:formylglycine-generating enzyme required for sulfatase activity
MSDFYKRFLMEDVPRAVPGANKQVFLGAFGKHPGWDDHIEDLGLETFSLVEAKKLFYVQGIGGEIDSGAWEKLDQSQLLPSFKHVFVWQRPGQYLIGRLWSSSDGKGRTRYPMVVCAHCAGVSLAWALDHVLPRLEQIEQDCATTRSAADVRSILDQHRADLRAVASGQTTDLTPPSLDTAFIAKFAARPELGPQQEGWVRILYAVQSQCGAFAKGRFNPKSVASTIRPQQIRVPRAADSISKAVVQWSGFFLTQVDPHTPMLLTVPLEEQWLDVTLGEPASQELFPLRATPKAVPLASEVPYTISPEFRDRARQLVNTLEAGRPPASILAGGTEVIPTPPSSQGSSPRSRFFRWLGGGAAVVALAAAITAALLPRDDNTRAPGADGVAATPLPGDIVAARPSPEVGAVAPSTPPETVVASASAEEKRAAEVKLVVEEREKAAAAAKLKAIGDEQEKVRVAADAANRRDAEEKQLADQKRAVEAKARSEAAATSPGDLALRQPETPKPVTQATTQAPHPAPGPVHTNTVGMVFVRMPGGYWVGKHEVSQAEFQKVTGRNPSVQPHPSRPVESVNWEDASEFCRKLTQREEAAGALLKGWAYSLPTEAQWMEFAGNASLGTGISSLQRKRAQSEPVGSGPANQFSLHDVRGNVWEWCLSTNDQKVLRGGAFDTIRGFAAAAQPHDYWKLPADQRRSQAGFRCVLVKQQ